MAEPRGTEQQSSAPLVDITNTMADEPSALAAVANFGGPNSEESLATDCALPCEAAALGSPGQPTSQDTAATSEKRKGKAKPNRRARARGRQYRARQAEKEAQAALPDTDAQQ